MNNFAKKLGFLSLGISLIAGVSAAMLTASKNIIKVDATPEIGTTYTLVTSDNELVEGANYTILGGAFDNYDALSTYVQQDYIRGIRIVTKGSFPTSFVSTKTATEEVLNLKLVKYTENEQVKWAFKTTNYYGTNGYLGGGTNKLLICDTPHSATFSINTSAVKHWASIYLEGSDLHVNFTATTPGKFTCSNNNGISLYKAATTAKDWADDFLDTTNEACADPTKDNREAVEAVWNSTVNKFNLLTDADKAILKSATYEDENLGVAIKRYEFIIKKYSGSSIITNYISRTIPSNYKLFTVSDNTTPILIATVVTLVSVSVISGYFFVKKTKHK